MLENEMSDIVPTIMLDGFDKKVHIGSSSVIGRRSEQQDAIRTDDFYAYVENERAICVLCDGMGGLNGGARASALCTAIVHNAFHKDEAISDFPAFFRAVIRRADEEVRAMKTEDGAKALGAGTTMVSVVIDGDQMYWASVGDSRIYIIRAQEIVCITADHNYYMLLNEKVKNGELSQEEADSNPKKEALISYIGIGGVRYIDMNKVAFGLCDGDCIVMCSDGLYRSVTEEEIKSVLNCFSEDVQEAAEALTTLALSKELRNQDNTSVVVIQFQNQGNNNI